MLLSCCAVSLLDVFTEELEEVGCGGHVSRGEVKAPVQVNRRELRSGRQSRSRVVYTVTQLFVRALWFVRAARRQNEVG